MTVLENAARLLKCFNSECTDLTVTDVTERLDIPKANASRLLKAMRGAGLLETIGDSKRHRPGRLLIDLGAAFRGSSTLIAMAGEVVKEVSDTCGHTGFVSIRVGNEVSGVVDFPGSNALRVAGTIGRPLPAHTTATGRSLLARLSDAEVVALLRDATFKVTPRSPGTIDEVLAMLTEVRACGFGASFQETTLGVDAVGIAVGDPKTGEEVSLCIVFPSQIVSDAERQAILTGLADGAADIAFKTGDTRFKKPDPARFPLKGLTSHD